jgi:hypothetical protein
MKLLQAKDVAEILSCSESHVYQLDKRGILSCSHTWPCEQGAKSKRPRLMRRWTVDDVGQFLAKYRNNKNTN